jgi:YHS domain-containing protein
MGLREFDRLDDAVAAGQRAAEAALPALARLLACPQRQPSQAPDLRSRYVDPVCAMVLHPTRARATATHEGIPYYFCSVNCRDRFLRSPARYIASTSLDKSGSMQAGKVATCTDAIADREERT